ncbi:hypothetical protein QYE76_037841 [Lolium multiflorum]|uniref:DUF4216 domain-containing protein n=1 Tax=Lolium multiflorum TaxID=4521 RepID=A0AAD8T7R0_LOLMU|nr:hypothetical protein QYE76_037841 [Lolium multiflorum]
MLATAPILASPLEREPMLLYIAATNRVVSVVVVVEREEEGKTVQRPVYYLSEVLSLSKQNYPHFQKMTYGVYMAATKLKHYFEEHPMKVVSEAPISDIMCNKDASGRIAKWAIQISPYVPVYERRDAIKSQALADFLVDWAEMQYKPPDQRIEYWKMHFDGSKLKEGLGAGVVLTSPKGDHLRFFKDGTETRFNKDDRNQDIRRKPDPDEMEVFSVGAKGLGKSILKHFDKEFDNMVWYVLNNCDDVERYINEFRQELGGRGVRDIEETVQREFAGWFANHVRQLDNASEDLKSLAAGPDRRVVVYAGCNVKGARFRTLTRDKDLKTQNSGVATKGSFGDADETDYYGVLQEVLELQYGTNKHGDRSVYLFRCDWFDLASKGSKIKDDGFFKSVNTSILWFKNSPFILASQAETCFYLEDTKFGDPWKVVQKFSHRHVYDVPELEDGNDDAFVRNEDAYQEDEGSVDHTFHDVVDLDEEAEVEAEEDDHRAAEVVRIHDARTIRELENEEDSPNVDMDMSEDELENQEDSVILEENIHDDEGKNSEEDSDLD